MNKRKCNTRTPNETQSNTCCACGETYHKIFIQPTCPHKSRSTRNYGQQSVRYIFDTVTNKSVDKNNIYIYTLRARTIASFAMLYTVFAVAFAMYFKRMRFEYFWGQFVGIISTQSIKHTRNYDRKQTIGFLIKK